MLDIALLMANASQLKAVIEQGPSFAFYVPLVVLISVSLVLQIGVGVLLIFLGVRLCPGGREGAGCSPPRRGGRGGAALRGRRLWPSTHPSEDTAKYGLQGLAGGPAPEVRGSLQGWLCDLGQVLGPPLLGLSSPTHAVGTSGALGRWDDH